MVDPVLNGVPTALGAASTASVCRMCGATRIGPYCHACGQASSEAPRTFREVFMGQTGRLLHTLRLLFTRPGALAREIDEGRDRRSLRPLTLLLNLIPLFFLLGGGEHGFGTHMFAKADPTGNMESAMVKLASRRNVSVPVMEERVEQRFRAVYSLLVVVQAITYGLAIGLMERRHRKPWLVHMAAGIHYMCFSFVVSTLVFGAIRLTGATVSEHPVFAYLALPVNLAYLGVSLHRIYGDTPVRAGALAVAVMAMNFVVALTLTGAALVTAMLTA